MTSLFACLISPTIDFALALSWTPNGELVCYQCVSMGDHQESGVMASHSKFVGCFEKRLNVFLNPSRQNHLCNIERTSCDLKSQHGGHQHIPCDQINKTCPQWLNHEFQIFVSFFSQKSSETMIRKPHNVGIACWRTIDSWENNCWLIRSWSPVWVYCDCRAPPAPAFSKYILVSNSWILAFIWIACASIHCVSFSLWGASATLDFF